MIRSFLGVMGSARHDTLKACGGVEVNRATIEARHYLTLPAGDFLGQKDRLPGPPVRGKGAFQLNPGLTARQSTETIKP